MKKGDYVVVRGDRSGVFAGYLKSMNKQEVILTKGRKLWYWKGAYTIENLAVDGTSNPSKCNFTVVVDEMVITDVIQVLPTTKKAEKVVKGVKEWKS